jgi:hypothetical protein
MAVNLTAVQLDEATTVAAPKGLNFVPLHRRESTSNYIRGVQISIRKLSPNEAEEVRQEVTRVLKKYPPPPPPFIMTRCEGADPNRLWMHFIVITIVLHLL